MELRGWKKLVQQIDTWKEIEINSLQLELKWKGASNEQKEKAY